MKGDRIEILVDAGQNVRTFELIARRAGRRLETTTGRGVVEVTELTRTGQPVRTARFMAARVVAVVEHPAASGPVAGEPTGNERGTDDAPRVRRAIAS
jgi:hypothetical protein